MAPRLAVVDWKAVRDQVDLAKVATDLLGPSPGRRGERGRRLWWCCPFHEDSNPSFCIDPGKPWYRWFGCGARGDAATLLMKLGHRTFPEAVRELNVGSTLPSGPGPRPSPRPRPDPPAPAAPSGLPEADALALVEASSARLWTPEGAKGLAYLTGPDRGLTSETIRRARLGWTPGVDVPRVDGSTFRALGVVLPYFSGGRLALVKVRQPPGRRPKYAEVFRDPARLVCYPGPEAIRPGRPLIIVEGEFDTLCLGQVIEGVASVMTLGSASMGPTPETLSRFFLASTWYVATDADPAGDRAAAAWPARARRVRPPISKDWTEVAREGVNLARWWSDILDGNPSPPLYTWPELASRRWGDAAGDPAPGLDVAGGCSPETLARAMDPSLDPYDAMERAAIQGGDAP